MHYREAYKYYCYLTYFALLNSSFNQYLDESLSLLSSHGIYITRTFDGNIHEKAGVLALAATLHEINNTMDGVLSTGKAVLIGITGGTGGSAAKRPKPNVVLRENPTDEQLKLIL